MPAAIGPLIENREVSAHPATARCAVFYSISNCQPGLPGVPLGDFLIKRVCDILRHENPSVRRFCTLSPMPGFAAWLRAGAPLDAERLARGGGPRPWRGRRGPRPGPRGDG